jgi:hypothetical protein
MAASKENCKLERISFYNEDDDPELSIYKKSVEEILEYCQFIESIDVSDYFDSLWRRPGAVGPPAFESRTKILNNIQECDFNFGYNTPLFHPDTKFSQLESLDFAFRESNRIIDARAFWKAWFSRTWRTLKSLSVSQHYGTSPMGEWQRPLFTYMCIEASQSRHPLSLESLYVRLGSIQLSDLEFLARSPTALTLKTLFACEQLLDRSLVETFQSFVSLEHVSLHLPGDSISALQRTECDMFLRDYLGSAPASLKKLSLGNVAISTETMHALPLRSLESLNLRKTGLFRDDGDSSLNTGLDLEDIKCLESLTIDEDNLSYSCIIRILRGIPSLRHVYFGKVEFSPEDFERISKALELTRNICRFYIACTNGINVYAEDVDPENQEAFLQFKPFQRRFIVHCCKNRLNRALTWSSTQQIPLGFYVKIFRNMDRWHGPAGIYTTLQNGKALSDLGLS